MGSHCHIPRGLGPALNNAPLFVLSTAPGLSGNRIFSSAQSSAVTFKLQKPISGKLPFLELEIACSGLPFDHVIDPLGSSDAALEDAPHSGGDSIRLENFFKKIVDFLPDTKVSLGPV